MDPSEFTGSIETFHRKAERLTGQVEALSDANQIDAAVDLMLSEAIATYAIEGETLDRDSVRSSLLMHFGVEVSDAGTDIVRATTAADLIVDLRRNWHRPLSHEMLGHWQSLAVAGRLTGNIMRGAYRNDPGPMQLVSSPGRFGELYQVRYEAPPAVNVPAEMDRFLEWYNGSASGGLSHIAASL